MEHGKEGLKRLETMSADAMQEEVMACHILHQQHTCLTMAQVELDDRKRHAHASSERR
jgi:hypothetical protein